MQKSSLSARKPAASRSAPARGKRSRVGQDLLEAMKQIVAHERGEIVLPSYEIVVPTKVDVAKVRAKLGLSQRKFAARFGLDVTAVQAWEQGRRRPDRAALVLLTIIDREPEAVQRALRLAA